MTEKKIDTLVEDIYSVVADGVEVSEELTEQFGASVASVMSDRLSPNRGQGNYLRPSNVGEKCDRKTWLTIKRPEIVEGLPPDALLKFMIGDLWEQFLLFLAALAGHKVEGAQDVVSIDGISGSRDSVIDGVLVDVKSASSYSFNKFRNHLTRDLDAFGYIPQLNTYLEASQDDDIVTEKDKAGFLVGDKTLGKLTLDMHDRAEDGLDIRAMIAHKREVLEQGSMPARGYDPIPDGKSGNMKLGVECSYCPVKHACYPNLRTFLYSSGPVFLTEVVREPNVTEVH